MTATDARSVRLATEYKLTDENFQQFVKASDSLAALRKHDSFVNALLNEQISDAATGTAWCPATTPACSTWSRTSKINNAIVCRGDVGARLLRRLDRHRPGGAIPRQPEGRATDPALGKNIEFLQAHRAELQAMRQRDKAR